MNNLKYHIILFFLKSLALMPLWVLYRISDLFSLLIHKVIRYRVEIVRKNLRIAFPDKSDKELKKIEKRFFSYFCDCVVETIKLLHISDKQIRRRVTIENDDVIHQLASEGKPIILFMGHYANWEWVPALTLFINEPEKMGALYRTQHNKVMNRVILKIRSRFRSVCIPTKTAYRELLELKRTSPSFMIGFIADQRPLGDNLKNWTDFFNRPTAFLAGGETIGDRVGASYVYLEMKRVSRGHFSIGFHKIEVPEDDKEELPYTRQYFRMLEQTIRENPPYWLWSHNRWKAEKRPNP